MCSELVAVKAAQAVAKSRVQWLTASDLVSPGEIVHLARSAGELENKVASICQESDSKMTEVPFERGYQNERLDSTALQLFGHFKALTVGHE